MLFYGQHIAKIEKGNQGEGGVMMHNNNNAVYMVTVAT